MKDIAQPVRFKEMLTPWVLTLFCSLVATLGNLLVILQKTVKERKKTVATFIGLENCQTPFILIFAKFMYLTYVNSVTVLPRPSDCIVKFCKILFYLLT